MQAAVWGREWVVGGSDCGRLFLWERGSGRLRKVLVADSRVVNCTRPNARYPSSLPFLPFPHRGSVPGSSPGHEWDRLRDQTLGTPHARRGRRRRGRSRPPRGPPPPSPLSARSSGQWAQVAKKNAAMLEQTADTVTLPARFMLTMLMNMNRVRGTGSPSQMSFPTLKYVSLAEERRQQQRREEANQAE